MKFFRTIVTAMVLPVFAIIALAAVAQAQDYKAPDQPQMVHPLLIGATIPDAKLPDASGNTTDIKKALADKPTILVFYRGGWCPYCQGQLASLEKAHGTLDSLGYQVLAVSTDSPDNLRVTKEKRKLSYTLLSDADLSFAKKMGIAFVAPENYHAFLGKSSGGRNTESLLPVPAVYILNKQGEIKFEHIDPDYKIRMDVELLTHIASAYAASVK